MESIGWLGCEIEIVYNWMQPLGFTLAVVWLIDLGKVLAVFIMTLVWWYLCVKCEVNDRQCTQ